MWKKASALLGLLATPIQASPDGDGAGTTNRRPAAGHFLALGDWGGSDWWPYHTRAQVKTAAGMAKIASDNDSSFVLALGDNFYSHGLSSDVEAAHKRFSRTFERVYTQESLNVPWHVLAGNHDHLGNLTNQFSYHEKDSRWNFPSYHHRVVKEFPVPEMESDDPEIGGGTRAKGKVTVEVLLIDTIHLAGHHPHVHQTDAGYFDPLPGPTSLETAENQLAWIKNHLSSSSADYLLVAGHYPVYSGCSHGNTKHLIKKLDPMMREHGVTAYLSGHEHCQMHIKYDGFDYVITGTGDECCYNANGVDHLPPGSELKYILSYENNPTSATGGFVSFEVGEDKMSMRYHDQDGGVLYATELLPRKNQYSKAHFSKKGVLVNVEGPSENVVS